VFVLEGAPVAFSLSYPVPLWVRPAGRRSSEEQED
jgi:hypothetical protein